MGKFWIHFFLFLIRRSYNHWTRKFALENISFEISEYFEEEIKNGPLRCTEQIRQSYHCAHPAPVCLCGFITPHILNFRANWKWIVSFTLRPLHSLENRLLWKLNGRLGGPWSGAEMDGLEDTTIFYPTEKKQLLHDCQLLQNWNKVYCSIKFCFSDCASSCNSGKWPTWRTISSIIRLFEFSTCFEQLCAHPQEDNCINTTFGINTLC
jgi:hypothetical protein